MSFESDVNKSLILFWVWKFYYLIGGFELIQTYIFSIFKFVLKIQKRMY